MLRLTQASLWLPVMAAVGSISALPPVSFTVVGLVTLVPLYLFSFSGSPRRFITGLVLYTTIFSGYTTIVTVGGFTWFDEAVVFHWFVYVVGALIILLIIGLVSIWGALVYRFYFIREWWLRVILFSSFVLIDLLLTAILGGFNYGSFLYVGIDLIAGLPDQFQSLSTPLYLLAVVFVNALLGEVLISLPWQRTQVVASLLGVVIGVVGMMFLYAVEPELPTGKQPNARIAIIQDPTTDQTVAFGVVRNRSFSFPRLEETLATLRQQPLDIIIYPFNLWSGTLGESSDDNLHFDRQVVVITTQQFSKWLQEHIAPETIFVTWYTRYESGNFYNEVGYWKNGKMVAVYQKEQLFPFFDYTPQWAQEIGFFTTPIDATPAKINLPVTVNQIVFGHAICSEITNTEHVTKQLETSDVLLSIGSEAMFSNEIPSVFNSVKARTYAMQQQKTVIRATRTGPSVVFAANGEIKARLGYNQTGVLIADIP